MKQKNEKLLTDLRGQIDSIDSQILDLINQRLKIGIQVGRVKKESNTKIMDPARELEVINRIIDINQGPASKEVLRYVFNVIIGATREIQKPVTISYLGPEATYSHIAALTHFKHSGEFIKKANLYGVFKDIDKGDSHFGVVPIENSIEGAVNHTFDLFTEFDLNICAEHYEPISHDLLSITGDPKDVKTIISHPQPIAQCRNWIKNNFDQAEIRESSSTSIAAQLACEDKSIAAIASKQAAHLYSLQKISSQIEDQIGNTTRFLIIGREKPARTGNDKTSIMFATPHVPGALFKALSPIDEAGLNMVKLESRPTRHQNWNYYFFVDVEGHHEDKVVADTIKEISKFTLSLKILGSYPVFENKS